MLPSKCNLVKRQTVKWYLTSKTFFTFFFFNKKITDNNIKQKTKHLQNELKTCKILSYTKNFHLLASSKSSQPPTGVNSFITCCSFGKNVRFEREKMLFQCNIFTKNL